MTLPPLPLVEGALLIDNSTIELLQTCPRSMQYAYLRKRTASRDKPALNFGSAIHDALAFRYKTFRERPLSQVELAKVLERLDEFFLAHPQSEGDYRTLSLARNILSAYSGVWKHEPWKIVENEKGPVVEGSFAAYIGHARYKDSFVPVYWTGRIDLLIEDNQGLWVVDHKTSSMFGDSFWDDMAMSAQQLGYVWTTRQALGVLPRGYMINGIRTRKPTKIDAYCDDNGVRADDFGRQFYYVSDDQLSEWQRNTMSLIEEFLWHHGRDYMPRKSKWCVGKYGLCQFYDVCSLPQSSRETMLTSSAYEDSVWTPLNKPLPQNEIHP